MSSLRRLRSVIGTALLAALAVSWLLLAAMTALPEIAGEGYVLRYALEHGELHLSAHHDDEDHGQEAPLHYEQKGTDLLATPGHHHGVHLTSFEGRLAVKVTAHLALYVPVRPLFYDAASLIALHLERSTPLPYRIAYSPPLDHHRTVVLLI